MSSFLFFSLGEDLARGNVNFQTDTFYAMVVTSAYTPSQAHSKRSDITNEVSGTGYPAGGQAVAVGVSRVNGVTSLTFSPVVFADPVSGFTGRRAIVYKRRGGAASADELVGCIDPGADVPANGGTYTVTASTPLTITVPTGV